MRIRSQSVRSSKICPHRDTLDKKGTDFLPSFIGDCPTSRNVVAHSNLNFARTVRPSVPPPAVRRSSWHRQSPVLVRFDKRWTFQGDPHLLDRSLCNHRERRFGTSSPRTDAFSRPIEIALGRSFSSIRRGSTEIGLQRRGSTAKSAGFFIDSRKSPIFRVSVGRRCGFRCVRPTRPFRFPKIIVRNRTGFRVRMGNPQMPVSSRRHGVVPQNARKMRDGMRGKFKTGRRSSRNPQLHCWKDIERPFLPSERDSVTRDPFRVW